MLALLKLAWIHFDSINLIIRLTIATLLTRLGKSVAVGISVSRNKRLVIQAEAPNSLILAARIHKIKKKFVHVPQMYLPTLNRWLSRAKNSGVPIYIWGYGDILAGFDASQYGGCYRLEVAQFGVHPTLNYNVFSYVCDSQRPYFDGRGPTDLEDLLNSIHSGDWKKAAADREFIERIRESDFQKYKEFSDAPQIHLSEDDIVVVGQCRGDAAWTQTLSVVEDNVELVKKTISEASLKKVYYKPHPLNTANTIEIPEISRMPAVEIIPAEVSFATVAKCQPKIVVNTSGAGLEAALRGCKVETYGISFFSNWGFTKDHLDCPRRTNSLSPEDLFWCLTKFYIQYYDRTLSTKIPLHQFLAKLDSLTS